MPELIRMDQDTEYLIKLSAGEKVQLYIDDAPYGPATTVQTGRQIILTLRLEDTAEVVEP